MQRLALLVLLSVAGLLLPLWAHAQTSLGPGHDSKVAEQGVTTKVRIAYIEEPPFYWTSESGEVLGADIDVAQVVLRRMGVKELIYVPTSFEELLRGLEEYRWDISVPIFITPERSKRVAFSLPVWALSDGFLVASGNPRKIQSYQSLASQPSSRLATVAGTVQVESAKAAGIGEDQIVTFRDQPAAIAALQSGQVDAYVGTAVGNRALLRTHPQLEAVDHLPEGGKSAPMGGFLFNKANASLIRSFNEQLQSYLGSEEHRERMKKYGFTDKEIDGALLRQE